MAGPAAPTLIVVNPASGGRRTGRRWLEIQAAVRAARLEVTADLTLGPGDATGVTRSAITRRGIHRVVAVGGDGTLSEVVNGCFGENGDLLAADLTVGLIPSGTASDFRRSAGIPDDPAAAVRLLASGASRTIDVGRITFPDGSIRHFLNIASCGISADVVATVNRMRRGAAGRLRRAAFLGAGVAALLGYRNRDVQLTLDGRTRQVRVEQIAVANGRAYGGGMLIAPDARTDDGLFDVVVVGDISRGAALSAIPRLYRGTHLTLPTVECARARSVGITPSEGEDPPLIEADGELVGQAPAELTILPGALHLVAPC